MDVFTPLGQVISFEVSISKKQHKRKRTPLMCTLHRIPSRACQQVRAPNPGGQSTGRKNGEKMGGREDPNMHLWDT